MVRQFVEWKVLFGALLVSNVLSMQEDSVPELPEIPALQHLAKARPKRPKKHAATRGVAKVILCKDYKY